MLAANNLEPYFEILAKKSWVLIPFDIELAQKLLNSAQLQFNKFKIGTTPQSQVNNIEFRQDHILWINPELTDTPTIDQMIHQQLKQVSQELRHFFRTAISEIECHYAYYEAGKTYVKHRDSTHMNNRRIFSFVIYLNLDWPAANGGQLRGYDETGNQLFEVLPQAGQMILFESHLEHEVKPATQTRYSLAGWMRR